MRSVPTWMLIGGGVAAAFGFGLFKGFGLRVPSLPNGKDSDTRTGGEDVATGKWWNTDTKFNHWWNLDCTKSSSGLQYKRPYTDPSNYGGSPPAFSGLGGQDIGAVGELYVDYEALRSGKAHTAGVWRVGPGFNLATTTKDRITPLPVNRLVGDPRALAVLMWLLVKGKVTGFHTYGLFNPATRNTSGHKWGYAIDIASFNDGPMNALLNVAYDYDIPLAWISRTKGANGKFPYFQVRNRAKTQFSHSSQDHTSHFHLDLPRPNFILQVVEHTKGRDVG